MEKLKLWSRINIKISVENQRILNFWKYQKIYTNARKWVIKFFYIWEKIGKSETKSFEVTFHFSRENSGVGNHNFHNSGFGKIIKTNVTMSFIPRKGSQKQKPYGIYVFTYNLIFQESECGVSQTPHRVSFREILQMP